MTEPAKTLVEVVDCEFLGTLPSTSLNLKGLSLSKYSNSDIIVNVGCEERGNEMTKSYEKQLKSLVGMKETNVDALEKTSDVKSKPVTDAYPKLQLKLRITATKDGTIDMYGKPTRRDITGGWRTGKLVLVVEGLAALAFTGVEVNMVLFSKSVLRQSNAEAAKTFSVWMGTLDTCTLLKAFLSYSYLGRYLICVVLQAVLLIELVVLSLSTQESMLEPNNCGNIGTVWNQLSPAKVACFYKSAYLLALGSGAMEPNYGNCYYYLCIILFHVTSFTRWQDQGSVDNETR